MNSDSAAIATLGIRVTSMEGRVNELNAAVSAVQSTLSTKIDALAGTLGGKIEERSRTPWAIYLAGGMAFFTLYTYMNGSQITPLKEKDADIVSVLKEMRADIVPERVHARSWAQNDERFQRLEDRIKFGETAQVDRIKRLEELYGSSYNLRDAIQQMDSRIQHFERLGAEKKAP